MSDAPISTDLSQLKQAAITAAKNHDWTQAIKLNQTILQLEPDNLPALKRLAYAFSSTQNYSSALSLYQKVLKLDKYDSIAKSNITKLTHINSLKNNNPCHSNHPNNLADTLLKVNENAISVPLTKITQKPIWHQISPGVPVEIISSRNGLTANLAKSGQYIGRVNSDAISPLLCKKIIKGKYQAIIQCPNPEQIQILIRY